MGEALRHYLVVTDDGERDVTVEHDPNCPYEESRGFLDAPGVAPLREYKCEVGIVESFDGLECFPAAAELAPGRYEIEAWSEPGRWHGANYSDPDGGLRLVDEPDAPGCERCRHAAHPPGQCPENVGTGYMGPVLCQCGVPSG